MPSEQKKLFCDEKHSILQKDNNVKNEIIDTLRSVPNLRTSESSCHYKLRNVKISLPRINIPNEVLLKHEIDRYRKLFPSKRQTARKSVNIKTINSIEECMLLPKSEITEDESRKMSAKILNFSCSKCQDDILYSPNDLHKHFQMWHYGELPSYPCEMCSFSASDFQVFKQHRHTHKSTFVKCDICNNENVYTLLDLTKHFISTHCINGNFQCERCKFSTQDVGTFVQHIHRHNEISYKCGKCRHVCFSKEELQKHLHLHSNGFPFVCQCCGYGATKRYNLVRHVTTFHREHLYAKEKLEKDKYEKRMAKTSAGLKLILKRYKVGTSRKTFWKRKKINSGNDGKRETYTQILKANRKQTNDQTCLVEECLSKKKDERVNCVAKNDKPAELQSDKPTLLPAGQCNGAEKGSNSTSGPLKTFSVQGPTVLMVKNNKITVPANYSAKFMGFKMVDGKQHIVIKLLPANKSLYSLGLQSGASKDTTASLQPQTSDTTRPLPAGVATELNNTVYMKTTQFSCSPMLSGKVTSEKEMALISQMNNTLTVGNEKSAAFLPGSSELVTASVNLPTKVETKDTGTDLQGNGITQIHPQVLGTTITSQDKINSSVRPNAYSSGDMHNYCANYANSELPVEASNQGSLPFHNYSKVNNSSKHHRFTRTAVCVENPQRESSRKMMVQQPISESVLSLVKKESLNPDSLLVSISLLNSKYKTKTQAEIEEQGDLGTEPNTDGQKLYADENENPEGMTDTSKWDNVSRTDSPMMPRITSVFSLQSQQASEFLPPEVNQLLQDVLKTKSDIKQDSNNIPNESLPLHCDQSFQKHEQQGKIVGSKKDLKVQDIFPIPAGSTGVNEPANHLNLKYNGKQGLSMSQNIIDLEKTPRISGIGTLLKTQSDAIITHQLVKDKLRATTQNLNSVYIQNPLVNAKQRKAVFVQTPKGLLVPLHVASKPALHVVSGRPLSFANPQGVPAALLNKKPGMILTFNNGKLDGVSSVKTENAQSCGGITAKEPCKTPFLKAEPSNNNCLTPVLCSSIGSCVSMKSGSEKPLPLKGPYIIKTSANSSVKPVPTPTVLSEHQGTKNILDSGKQQKEVSPEPPLYTLLPDGKQALFLKCVMPNNTELLKPKVVQNSTYHQNIQPKTPEGTPPKILLKIFNPVLNVSGSRNPLVNHSASSQHTAPQTTERGQKEPESSKDALPLLDDLMPANEIVVTSTAACPESSEEPVRITNCSDSRVLRSKMDCTNENFDREKTSRRNFARLKTRVGSKDSEIIFASRDRNCKRKCRNSYQEPPRKKPFHRKRKEKAKAEDSCQTLGPRLPKDSVRTLRLFPFSPRQLVKCPRRNQPVVVLNHPDADAPEVVNVMKTIAKFNGCVLKVALSERTMNALLKPVYCIPSTTTYDEFSKRHKTFKPVCSVKERFVLKLTLKKTSKNNYQIVKTTSKSVLQAKFSCWFCGRVFDNQDAWAGHGQRHLMEATRDWNMLE
ncbi:PREDICTED: zinc finger protein 518A [Elephantulus edwardii]|uniref:zinc finger protein 518A n=1 Tax=Elephantulus edwardii TaxID=28737 RepID=UPI0003F0B504|nr:PREDICTED: zinc finger protein 518A [Elephantulus edwardii]